ncbi:MAG: tRNA pseudouridine(55) synthase TruB [candidate division WOR-3 bacterium]|nr:tRNA pseudouridine(55) synthase TruB [candidate division WOR-3 bacterium]
MTCTKSPIINKSEKTRLRGVLLLNKPVGVSSYDCIRKIKPIIPKIKIGHAGTLDPIAQGLLIILLGEATKIAQYLSFLDKEYIAKVRLGITTDTDDITGKVIKESPYEHINKENIINVINSLKDIKTQQPPRYSALKYQGKRMYDLARQNINFTPKAKPVKIKQIEILGFNPPWLEIKTTVSKGTYIRALARDIGEFLGCGATLEELIRTKIGKFRIQDAIDLENISYELIEKEMYSLNEVLNDIPAIVVSETIIRKVLNGQPLSWTQTEDLHLETDLIRITDNQNRILIIGKCKDNKIYPDRVIYADLSD